MLQLDVSIAANWACGGQRVRTTTPDTAADRPLDLVRRQFGGVRYLSMRYSERLADAGIAPSVGSRADSYDR